MRPRLICAYKDVGLVGLEALRLQTVQDAVLLPQ